MEATKIYNESSTMSDMTVDNNDNEDDKKPRYLSCSPVQPHLSLLYCSTEFHVGELKGILRYVDNDVLEA
jgi:hypothetical protein